MTDSVKVQLSVPREILDITETLQNKGFLAYLVGGCVRDSLIGRQPKDWDITTNATPEQIQPLFTKTVYENLFGTVTIVNEEVEDKTLRNIEVTPFRTEANYSDRRHPDKIKFSDKLEDDLSRRDFTINALAYNPAQSELIDLYGGIRDIKDKLIKTVGEADLRLSEDALRMLRAIRLACELDFTCNKEVLDSIYRNSGLLKEISIERIRDEFVKMIDSPKPMEGLILSHQTGILQYIVPELEKGIGMEQKGEHVYDIWEHTLRAIQHAADKNYPLHVKLAALFHDIGKTKTRRVAPEGKGSKEYTFYGHEVVGERMTVQIMSRLKFSNKETELVQKMVRNHMFFADPEKITLSAVRRVIVNVGPEHVWDLMNLRICDRIGMGRPKEEPYRLRKYESMIEEALRAPTSVGMLKIDGKRVMEVTRETPGPKIGHILNALLEEALENPDINNEEFLVKRAGELAKLSEIELKKLADKGKDKKEEVEQEELKKIRNKYRVK
ncbi:MAG: HD domain-containing protein [Candidatus Paceibacterota bacterium]|jgi:poly(A) polymerase/tRNA nucleotidyltransferase (CCA-adding enzyme)